MSPVSEQPKKDLADSVTTEIREIAKLLRIVAASGGSKHLPMGYDQVLKADAKEIDAVANSLITSSVSANDAAKTIAELASSVHLFTAKNRLMNLYHRLHQT